MRLLNAITLEIESFQDDEMEPYAILSHRWQSEEVIYEDVVARHANTKKGYEKVTRCCSTARANGFEYVWVDTLCIDKTSSAELSEAINSMYYWYQQADVCYAYLADVTDLSDFSESEWFQRGWTLQELIAPPMLRFFNREWQELGTKEQLAPELSTLTGISINILLGKADLDTSSVAQRMSWAAGRATTRIEDRAYSLMGIFGINMPLLYGEGKRAFVRLQEEILKISDDTSIFAWQSPDMPEGILATSPDAFKASATIISLNSTSTSGPLTISNKGIHMEVCFIGLRGPGIGIALLECTKSGKKDFRFVIYLKDMFLTMEYFERIECNVLGLLNLKEVKRSQYPMRKICVRHRHLAPTRIAQNASVLDHRAVDELMPKILTDQGDLTLLHTARNMDANRVDSDGMTPLLNAARKAEAGMVWLLLTRSDTRLNHADKKGRTALWYAADIGDEAVARILTNHNGIEVDIKDRTGRTALSHAVAQGHDMAARHLIETGKADLESLDEDGRTPLSLSVVYKRENLLRLLLENDVNIEATDTAGQTPLLIATEAGLVRISNILLEKGADPEAKSKYGQTALSLAAQGGHEAICKQLLEKGARAESKDNTDKTPLAHAVERGFERVMRLLLRYGADMESKDSGGRTPLLHAVKSGHELIVQELLEKGADFVSQDNPDRTPLLWAMEKGHEKIVEALLDKGAATNIKDGRSQTALILASKMSHVRIAKMLLVNNADPNSSDASGRTPLMWAAVNGQEKIVELLLSAGAEVNQRDANNDTALLIAVRVEKESIVEMLLDRGAATEISDKSGWTPLLRTSITDNGRIAQLLLEHGADPNSKGRQDRTPLWNAIYGDHHWIAQTLLEYDIDQNEKDAMLGAAANHGKVHLVRLLLEKGANANSEDFYGSPLTKAIDRGHRIIVELLIDNGADIESVSGYYKRSLQWLLDKTQ